MAWAPLTAGTLACAVAGLLVPGCAAKNKADGTPATQPAAESAPGSVGEDGFSYGDKQTQSEADDLDAPADLESLERELAQAEADLYARGVELSAASGRSYKDAKTKASEAGIDESGANRCTRICGLQEAVCGLQTRICTLAQEHEGEVRYAEVCERATQGCTEASKACNDC